MLKAVLTVPLSQWSNVLHISPSALTDAVGGDGQNLLSSSAMSVVSCFWGESRGGAMVSTRVRVGLIVSLLMTCAPLFAHHGSATYDTQKVVVLKDATITKFIWANPHSIAMFDVKDDKGNVSHWAAEAGSPSALTLIGWTKNSLKPGDVVTVYTFQSKNGNPVGRLNKIVLTDGTTLKDSQLGDADSKEKSEKPY
jgi:hypothetical protein